MDSKSRKRQHGSPGFSGLASTALLGAATMSSGTAAQAAQKTSMPPHRTPLVSVHNVFYVIDTHFHTFNAALQARMAFLETTIRGCTIERELIMMDRGGVTRRLVSYNAEDIAVENRARG